MATKKQTNETPIPEKAVTTVVKATVEAPLKHLPFNRKFLDNVSCSFHCHKDRTPPSVNPGTDIAMPVGSPVYAAHNGVVIVSDNIDDSAGGRWVAIDGPKGLETQYLHLSRAVVKKGARVAAGSLIGYSGNTGASTGPHLHFTMKLHGKNVDSAKYISYK